MKTIDNAIIHVYPNKYKFLQAEINFRAGNKIVSRVARKDQPTAYQFAYTVTPNVKTIIHWKGWE